MIIEESISGEKFGSSGHKAEFRIVFVRDFPGFRDLHNTNYTLTGYYTKVSGGNKIAGNISHGGGYGEELYTVLSDLVSRRFPKSTDLEVRQKTIDTANDLFEKTELFLDGFIRKYREQAVKFKKETLECTTKIAVDVIPVWNNEKNKFEWYFLELNGDRADNKSTWALSNNGMKRANPVLFDNQDNPNPLRLNKRT